MMFMCKEKRISLKKMCLSNIIYEIISYFNHNNYIWVLRQVDPSWPIGRRTHRRHRRSSIKKFAKRSLCRLRSRSCMQKLIRRTKVLQLQAQETSSDAALVVNQSN